MDKYSRLLILVLTTSLCYGQTGLVIRTEAETIEEFIPKGWKIIRSAKGDLNKDKSDDAALVIQEMDRKNVKINNGLGIDTLDSNPRVLIVLLMDTTKNKFKLIDISKTFILNHTSPTMDDPFDGITISKGILGIGFHFWYSAGSWYQSTIEYKFWFQKNGFALIGAEYDQTHRATMERVQRSFNFLTKKMSETTTSIVDDSNGIQTEKTKTKWRTLNFKELKTIKTLTAPLQWAVSTNVSI